MAIVETTPPADFPVSLTELKNQLRITDDFEDAALTIYRNAAVKNVESWQKRQLITATFNLLLDRFPRGDIILPLPPLLVVNSVQYIDSAGDTQTWSSAEYEVDTGSIKGRIHRLPNFEYPQIQDDRINAVTIGFDAGYGTASSSVPDSTRLAILQLAAEWYEFREPVIQTSIATLPFHLEHLVNAESIKEVI